MGDDKHGHGNGHGHGHGHDKPTDLGQKVDWMTYTHQQLWEMINTGVDLKAAGSAQADWATVGKALGEVQELLAKAIGQAGQAWTGESADRAREALESVEKWALNTSEHADNVARCIATEINHVQTAREMMPPPAPAPPVVAPVADAPVATPRSPLIADRSAYEPVATPRSPLIADRSAYEPVAGGETPFARPITRSPFTGIDTVGAPAIESVAAADATHRQAAEVMAMFQQNSYEVDRTVPSFSPPTNPVAPPPPPSVVTPGPSTTPATHDGAGNGPVVVNQNQTQKQNQDHHPAGGQHHRPGGTSAQFGRPGQTGGRFTAGRGAMPTPVGPVGVGASGGGGVPAGPGAATGALGADRGGATPGSVTSQFQAPKSVTPQSGMIGAAPMAAPPPVAGGGNDQNRNRPGYLEDDDNVFGVDRKAAPPVIGL